MLNLYYVLFICIGIPWFLRWQRVCVLCGRPIFDPWVWKIPCRRKWQPTPVFLPWKPVASWAWWPTVRGVTKSQTRVNTFTFTFFICIAHMAYFINKFFNPKMKVKTFGKTLIGALSRICETKCHSVRKEEIKIDEVFIPRGRFIFTH